MFLPAPSLRGAPLRNWIAIAAALTISAPNLRAQGPGIIQPTFGPSEIGKMIGSFPSPGAQPSALDFQHGYFFIGSGDSVPAVSGTDSWYDISNPRSPALVSSLASVGHKVHAIGYWENFGISAHVATTGFRVLDMKNRSARPFNDVDVFPIWISVQAPYCYRAENGYRTRSNRMKVLSLANPDAPTQLANIDFGGSLSFYPANTHVVGNLMIASATQQKGVVVFDIGNPLEPRILSSLVTGDNTYTSMVYGSRIYTAESNRGVRVYDFSNPAHIADLGKIPVPNNPRYVSLKDGQGYICPGAAKLVVFSTAAPPASAITATHLLSRGADFTLPIGNMVAIGGSGSTNLSGLVAVAQAPDTQGPEVTFASPAANAVNQPLTSRVGFIMSDQIDVTSLNASTFMVRPVNGTALPGTYSTQNGIINFSPTQPLISGKVYEVVLPTGGIRDSVGNPIAATHTQLFSTGNSVNRPPSISSVTSSGTFSLVETRVTFTAAANDPDGTALQYSWDFGDGVTTGFSTANSSSHVFAAPGRYSVILRVTDGTHTASTTRLQVVTHPAVSTRPAFSTSIIHDSSRTRIWSVNPDTDTVTRFNASTLVKEQEVATPAHPTHLAIRPGYSEIWTVASRGDSIRIFDALTSVTLADIPLGYGAQPQGIVFSADGVSAFVALAGPGTIIKINASARTEIARLPVCPQPRALALHGDRLFVSRFISSDTQGEIHEIDAANFTYTRAIPLALDPGPDAASAGRGLPNYLTHMAISPDGRRLFVPSKKDNIQRGTFRDGQSLLHDITVRSILNQIDLSGNAEVLPLRKDVDNHGLPSAIVFSPSGDLAFVAYQDNNEVLVFDSANGNQVGGVDLGSGLAPQGLALTADGTLFVQNFLSRTVAAFDVSQLVTATGSTVIPLATMPAVSVEKLSPQILAGKKVFYNAADLRMSNEGYLSCATCHLDGGHDGRTWDFTDRGEGLRNTTDLRARAGMAHGPIHWSANFDEIQDFEHDIRNSFGGSGFLTNTQFHHGTRDQPLGDAKSGLSPDLDALAAYLASLTDYPASPHRDASGNMTPSAIAGRTHFQALACDSCHSHDRFTDSAPGLRHDVGTISPATGKRLGAPTTGIDTPTLRGLWETPPYLHDGSAATLAEVFAEAKAPANSAHATFRTLSSVAQQQLIDYLLQLDFPRTSPTASAAAPAKPTSLTTNATSTSNLDLAWAAPDSTTESYIIESLNNGQLQETVVASAEQALSMTALDPATAFNFRIRTRNVHGDSEWFGAVVARTWSLYQEWADSNGFPFATDPAEDQDRDGISLWLEYALALDPNRPDPEGLPEMAISGNQLTLSYLQAHPELNYRVETSTNLHDWTTAPVTQGIPDATKRVIANTPMHSEDSKRFLRLNVTE